MVKVTTAHTAYVEPAVLRAARALLDDVFSGEMTDDDWEHALGGIHALAWEGDVLIGHASVIQRRLWLGGRALRTGYVEGVGVRADRRRRGVAGALLDEIERVIRGGYDLGALGTTDMARPFYEARGWQLWQGPVIGADAARDRAHAGRRRRDLRAARVGELDVTAEITADWRDADVW